MATVSFAALVGCSSSTDIANFKYGKGNPGVDLLEGGDVRIERVFLADGIHNEMPDGTGGMTWLQVYQWTSTDASTTKALPPEGTCTDLRTGQFWPNSKLDAPSITDIDVGTVSLTNARGTVTLPKCTTATNLDKSGVASPCQTTSTPPRALGLMYGGLSAGSPQGAFLAGVPADTVQAGDDFTVNLGGKKADNGDELKVHIPKSYKTPLNIGSDPDVKVTGGQDLQLTWTPPDEASTGTDHTPLTHFGRLFVLDTTPANNGYPLSWVCVPKTDPATGEEIDGSITVPASVVNQWPKTGGLLVHAELTHYMEAVGGRRLDLVGIWCHVSPFSVQ